MRKLAVLAMLALPAMWGFAGSQVLTLKDGTTVYGTFVSGTENSVVFRDSNGARRRFDVNQIQSIDFVGGNNLPGNQSYNGPYSNGRYTNRAARAQRSGNPADVRILPAGTEIAVRTNENIDSNSATEGQTFSATIDRDEMDSSGNVVIPRGSNAQLVIRSVETGGVTGSPNLVLDLQSINVNGRQYLVNTEDVTRSGQTGLGANRRTGEYVGGGAVLGTLLGAVAGGGKGAAIGALAGAAAGGATQVLTRGKNVKVPAETELTFRLDQPMRLEAYQ